MDEGRLAAAWAGIDSQPAADFRALIGSLVADAPPAVAAFERASAYDSTGDPVRAVELYGAALAAGLTGLRRRRAVIQLASSLRNLGRAAESVTLLSTELATIDAAPTGAGGPDALGDPNPTGDPTGTGEEAEVAALEDAVRAFLALALADVGREREALGVALGALAPHLPRYQRSLGAYARGLTGLPGG